jgi:hypothetical protein
MLPLFLAGEAMAAGYDGRPEWRARFHLDDLAVHRLGKSVTRAAMSLPWLLLWALAPKQPNSVVVLLPVALAVAGVWGLFRMRTWGILALAGAAGATAFIAATVFFAWAPSGTQGTTLPHAAIATLLLVGAVLPFVQPIARQLVPSRS